MVFKEAQSVSEESEEGRYERSVTKAKRGETYEVNSRQKKIEKS